MIEADGTPFALRGLCAIGDAAADDLVVFSIASEQPAAYNEWPCRAGSLQPERKRT